MWDGILKWLAKNSRLELEALLATHQTYLQIPAPPTKLFKVSKLLLCQSSCSVPSLLFTIAPTVTVKMPGETRMHSSGIKAASACMLLLSLCGGVSVGVCACTAACLPACLLAGPVCECVAMANTRPFATVWLWVRVCCAEGCERVLWVGGADLLRCL